MKEALTRFDKIDPKLREVGWGVVEGSRIFPEYPISNGRVSKTIKPKALSADYVLIYKGVNLAVVEAKRDTYEAEEGTAQAIEYAQKLNIRYSYATNGNRILFYDMQDASHNAEVTRFYSPEELWRLTFGDVNEWRDKFYAQPPFTSEILRLRYYQEIAVNRVLSAIAEGKNRILLTLATGTGKTVIAFEIAYKLFQCKWNVPKTNNRPRILFLADRNILANQAFTKFQTGFANDALCRVKPNEIRKEGAVPMNASVFFTIFQTFMCGENGEFFFGQYPKDFFDFIIIDECHRGGANDESQWREIMNYFESAVQLGMTATPRKDFNVNTYNYFGDPVYQYSLKQGIEDGFLTPFRHCNMQSNIDDYVYSPEDEILSGEVEEGKTYTEKDFYNGNITIKQRDFSRVKEFMKYIKPDEKTLVFCATQNHAGQIRDMINKIHGGNPEYAVRVTANDGVRGEEYLKAFQDNEKLIPTVLTTSEKLSTGVDALNVRNIVLLRPINQMIEFKQIIGRGTRLYEGKYYFSIYDFVRAYEKFNDPSWDGEPVCAKCGNDPCTCVSIIKEPSGVFERLCPVCHQKPCVCPPQRPAPCFVCGQIPCVCNQRPKLEIRLSDGRTRKIKFLKTDMFWGADGKPVSAEEFLRSLFGKMPEFFSSIEDLQEKWSSPQTRALLLEKMEDSGYGRENLNQIRSLIDADNSDLLDVLEYIAYAIEPISREERAKKTEKYVATLTQKQQEFVNYIINAYIIAGIEELESDRLPKLLEGKFGSISDGIAALGELSCAKNTFLNLQKELYL